MGARHGLELCRFVFGGEILTTEGTEVHRGKRRAGLAWTAEGSCPYVILRRGDHEHPREGARRDAPGGRSVFAGVAFHEFVCRTRWTANGGSGVEPGSVLFAKFFAGRSVRTTQSRTEADAGESASVRGDTGGAASDQCN